ERWISARLADQADRIRLRRKAVAVRTARQRALIERQRESEKQRQTREQRREPCGARSRAGHPCRGKGLGNGGRCANHGGASTGPKTIGARSAFQPSRRRDGSVGATGL